MSDIPDPINEAAKKHVKIISQMREPVRTLIFKIIEYYSLLMVVCEPSERQVLHNVLEEAYDVCDDQHTLSIQLLPK